MSLWSIAIYDLGLSEEQFYSCTLKQIKALIKRKELAVSHGEYMLAQLTSYVINFSGASAPKNPTTPQQFMPSAVDVRKVKRGRPMKCIADEMREVMRTLMNRQMANHP